MTGFNQTTALPPSPPSRSSPLPRSRPRRRRSPPRKQSFDGTWSVLIVTETGHLRPRLPLPGAHQQRLGRLCGRGLVQRVRQRRRERRRDRDGFQGQPERQRHRPAVRRATAPAAGRTAPANAPAPGPPSAAPEEFSRFIATSLCNLQTQSPAHAGLFSSRSEDQRRGKFTSNNTCRPSVTTSAVAGDSPR